MTDTQLVEKIYDELLKTNSRLNDLNSLSKGGNLTVDVVEKKVGTKHDMSVMIFELAERLYSTKSLLQKSMKQLDHYKSISIKSQKECISLQSKLLEEKDNSLKAERNNTESVIQDLKNVVQKEVQSYSEIVRSGTNTLDNISSPVKILDVKNAVKDAIRDNITRQNRRKNAVIFGLEDEPGKKLAETVGELYHEMFDKTDDLTCIVKVERFNCTNKSDEYIPPIKVSFQNETKALEFLQNSNYLRYIPFYKAVYCSRDLTRDEQKERKILVSKLKSKITQFPENNWVIRHGKVTSNGIWKKRSYEGCDID